MRAPGTSARPGAPSNQGRSADFHRGQDARPVSCFPAWSWARGTPSGTRLRAAVCAQPRARPQDGGLTTRTERKSPPWSPESSPAPTFLPPGSPALKLSLPVARMLRIAHKGQVSSRRLQDAGQQAVKPRGRDPELGLHRPVNVLPLLSSDCPGWLALVWKEQGLSHSV